LAIEEERLKLFLLVNGVVGHWDENDQNGINCFDLSRPPGYLLCLQ